MKKMFRFSKAWADGQFQKKELVEANGIFEADSPSEGSLQQEAVTYDDSYTIIPALIDCHVHIHEKIGGVELADDFRSLNRLAIDTGYQAIGAFITEVDAPNGKPTLPKLYEDFDKQAKKEFNGVIRWHLTPRQSSVKDILPLLEKGCDLKFYTTYRKAGLYRSYSEIEQWMSDLSDLKPVMFIHCEDDQIITQKALEIPFKYVFQHSLRRPPQAEIKAVAAILELAVKYNYPVHIVHVSTPEAAKLVQQAKQHAPVTCETSPNYLILNQDDYHRQDGHRWIFSPPLRRENSRGELKELAEDGYFDVFASDHCPFSKSDKDLNKSHLEDVPCGVAGMGSMLPLLKTKLGLKDEVITPCLTTNAAKLLRLGNTFEQLKVGSKAKFVAYKDMIGSSNEQKYSYTPSYADTYNLWKGQKHTLKIIYHGVSLDPA